MTRRARWLLLALPALLLAPAAPAPAQDPLAPRMSQSVEHVRNIPMRGRANGGRLVGRYFYATTGVDLTILDVQTPEDPAIVSQTYFEPSAWQQADPIYLAGYEEDVDTNGRVLLRAEGYLDVVDVSDPRAPKKLGRLDGVSEHTISCLLDCTWAYGSEGAIVDLRDPRNPVAAGNWLDQMPDGSFGHDVTEVAPGIVLTATDPMFLLDARENPASPKLLATTDAPGFVHGTHWPNRMADRFALAGGEAVGPACDGSASATLQTYDTTGWDRNRAFGLVDEYSLSPGTVEDGRHVTSRYCGHWFSPHPRFRDGGLVSVAWYEHGTRFVQVGADGRMQEVGWFLRPDGWAWAAYWITDRIVYVTDNHSGIDILRFKGEIPASPEAPRAPASPPPSTSPSTSPTAAAPPDAALGDLVVMPSPRRCVGRRGLVLRVRRAREVRRLTARIDRRRPLAATGPALRRPLRLRRIPRRRFTVHVVATTADGRRHEARGAYRPCRGRR